jgi:hypothetical protein
MGWLCAVWLLTILLPIHGAMFLARRRDTVRIRKLVVTYWKLRKNRP